MRTLPKVQCPQSDDPDYWDVWTGLKERKIDWEEIAVDWQNSKRGVIEMLEDRTDS
jgi:hypothetical protein